MKGGFYMSFLRTLFLVFGIIIFLLPFGALAQTPQQAEAVDDTAFTAENTPVTIDVLANDSDYDRTTLTITSPPSSGTAAINGDFNVTYTPNTNTVGTDTFVYQICATGTTEYDTATVTIEIALVVPFDIKPGSCPNPLNLKSQGVLPVAILGTAEFDVSTIDRASIRLHGVAPRRSSLEDVATPFTGEITSCESCAELGPDGYMDLTLKFSTQEIVQAIGVDNVNDGDCFILTLTGKLNDGTPIIGEDVVRILKKGKVKPR
jgi:hypothetical protein